MSVPEPSKILTPWATSGLKNTIPATANPVTGNAGYDQGFPAINMTPKEAGGIPPFGQDFNGALFEITTALRYMQAGGLPTWSAELSTAIGGYPKGSTLLGSDGVSEYRSLVDSNTSDPNTGGANWAKNDSDRFAFSFASSGYQKLPSGLIIQWGLVGNSAPNPATAIFPIAFPTSAIRLVGSGSSSTANFHASIVINSISATGFTFSTLGGNAGTAPNTLAANAVNCNYIAVGF